MFPQRNCNLRHALFVRGLEESVMLGMMDSGRRSAERKEMPCYGLFMGMLLWGMRNKRAEEICREKADGKRS
jgi:hypothetical protein